MKKVPSRCLYNIQIYKHGREFGNVNFQIQQNRAVLNNIEINEQRRGYGSIFVKKVESYVRNIYGVQSISLLAWQPSGGDHVVKFYEKLGYKEQRGKTQTYDDSVIIYDLHEMWKKI